MAPTTMTPSVPSDTRPAWRPRVVLRLALRIVAGIALVAGAPFAGVVFARAREIAAATPQAGSALGGAAAVSTRQLDNDFVGVLVPPQMANLSPKADGRVLAVQVKLGQSVRAGDKLVSFDPREKQHDLAMAEAQLRVTQAGAAAASSDFAAARKRAARRRPRRPTSRPRAPARTRPLRARG
jgi:membrane fusion protein, macrolide-specific efflux system